MACTSYSLYIDQLDLDNAVGNTPPNQDGVMYVSYYDCNGDPVTDTYSAGYYDSVICNNDDVGFVTLYYYSNNFASLPSYSSVNAGTGTCEVLPTPSPTPTYVPPTPTPTPTIQGTCWTIKIANGDAPVYCNETNDGTYELYILYTDNSGVFHNEPWFALPYSINYDGYNTYYLCLQTGTYPSYAYGGVGTILICSTEESFGGCFDSSICSIPPSPTQTGTPPVTPSPTAIGVTLSTTASCDEPVYNGNGRIYANNFAGGSESFDYITISSISASDALSKLDNSATRTFIGGATEYNFTSLINDTYYVAIMDTEGRKGVSSATVVNCIAPTPTPTPVAPPNCGLTSGELPWYSYFNPNPVGSVVNNSGITLYVWLGAAVPDGFGDTFSTNSPYSSLSVGAPGGGGLTFSSSYVTLAVGQSWPYNITRTSGSDTSFDVNLYWATSPGGTKYPFSCIAPTPTPTQTPTQTGTPAVTPTPTIPAVESAITEVNANATMAMDATQPIVNNDAPIFSKKL
jgi:hypothetical protein